jgi:hypothetical protein
MFQIFCQMLMVSNSVEKKLIIPVLVEFLLLSTSLDAKIRYVRQFRRKARSEG